MPATNSVARSPLIDLTQDLDGRSIHGDVDSVRVSFDVYRDLPEIENKSYLLLITAYSDCLEGRVREFHRGAQKDWYRHEVVYLPPAGTTGIVLELGVDNRFPGTSACNSHAPLFDNVAVERFGGTVTAVDPSLPQARRLLKQNHPNPFNPSTTIEFEVPAGTERVQLRVFDAAGRALRTLVDGFLPAGPASVPWDGRDANGRGLASGVYFYELTAGDVKETRRMVLLK